MKADIALLQGRREDAAQFARDAYGSDSATIESQYAMAQTALSMGNVDEAIRILEGAYGQSDRDANVSFLLGQVLMIRGSDRDIHRAFEVFSSANLMNLSQELIDPLTIGAIRALIRANRCEQVILYVERPEVSRSPVLVATIEAYSELKRGMDAQASAKLDEALVARRPSDTRSALDFLARTLMEAGRLNDALPLLQELFRTQAPNLENIGLLLDCASRLRQHQVVLDTCQALYERGLRDWKLLEFESQFLETYDPEKAVSRLQEFIRTNPDHRIAKLRLAIVGMRYGKEGLLQLSTETLPIPEELPMRYAVDAVQTLQLQNQPTLAVDYAYRVLRSHFGEREAHEAYIKSLLPGVRPDIPVTMEMVCIGSAVLYTEVGTTRSEWVVIEDTEDPSEVFEEISASGARAKEMLGRRVGDTFLLAKNPFKDREGTINQIVSKYVRRYQVIGEEMEIQFGDDSVVRTMHLPPAEGMTLADLQPILDAVEARSGAASKIRENYKTMPCTIHIYGAVFGHTAYECLFDLAVSDEGFVRCAPPQIQQLADAISNLSTKSTIVLDLVALATLRLLGVSRQILGLSGSRFVLSPATFRTLKGLSAQSRFSTAHGTMHFEKGQHYFTQTTQEQSEKEKAAFEEWMRIVQQNTTVLSVPQLASLNPDRRDTLEKLFGQEGLESALLSLTPGSILWTDDLDFAGLATQELGAERVWTQAVIESQANRGLIDRSLADQCHAKLLGFRYLSTHFTGTVMAAALQVSNGSVDAFPMRQAIETFRNVTAHSLEISLRLLAQFIHCISVEPLLPETRCLAIQTLLDAFPRDPAVKKQLLLFRDQIARLMALNPFAQQDFVDCFNAWLRGGAIIKPFRED